jgi:hypothetical protein
MTVAHIYPKERPWEPGMSSWFGGYNPQVAICGSPRRKHAPLSDDSTICPDCAHRANVRLRVHSLRRKP